MLIDNEEDPDVDDPPDLFPDAASPAVANLDPSLSSEDTTLHPTDLHDKLSAIGEISTVQRFIKALDGASLDDYGLDEDIVDHLRNLIQHSVNLTPDDKDFRPSLDIFLADTYASEATYTAM